MVVKIILSTLIMVCLFFMAPVFGLQPYSVEEPAFEEAKEEAAKIKEEKSSLIKEILPLREERDKNLRPFVDRVISPDETISVSQPAIPNATPYIKPSAATKPAPNFIFLSFIVISFLAAYFFIRPKP